MKHIINEYEKGLNILDEKNKNTIKNKIYKNKNGEEEPFYVIFMSIDFEIYYPIESKKNDLISRLEEEFCKKYEEFKEYNFNLTVNGKKIRRYKTIEENEIKNGDIILINLVEFFY